MAYEIRFRQSARIEFEHFVDRFGLEIEAAERNWLERLADECETGEFEISTDALQLLAEATGESAGRLAMKKWWNQQLQEKLNSLWLWMRDRTPSWQFRMAQTVFQVPIRIGQLRTDAPALATTFFEIDRVSHRIIMTTFRVSGISP